MKGAILDTGPLVAFLSRRDRHHGWAKELLSQLQPPLRTCESVISEACFLLRRVPKGPESVLELLDKQLVMVSFSLTEELEATELLFRKYADVPMSLADACLVRMAERHPRLPLITTDSDFRRYRKNGRQVIPVLMP